MEQEKVIAYTQRLQLELISYKYAQDIFNAIDETITKYMAFSPPSKLDDTKDFIRERLEKYQQWKDLQMVIIKKDTKEFLGNIGIHRIQEDAPELWICLKKQAWWQGYASEALSELINRARENINYQYLKYLTVSENTPSIDLIEKLWWEKISSYLEEETWYTIFIYKIT